MRKRKMNLAGSWYPDSRREIERLLNGWTKNIETVNEYNAAIVPHAGWYFSGEVAAAVLKQVCHKKELVIIFGGHLPENGPVLAAFEDEFEIPGGSVKNRTDLLNELSETFKIEDDAFYDNSVEVNLPIASFFAPGADFICLRVPPAQRAVEIAGKLYEIIDREGINAALIGSTDLTHYGPDYYFMPEGTGADAVRWVKEKNDAGIIEEMINMDSDGVLKHAAVNKSACSAGAAAAAVKFGKMSGAVEGQLVKYSNSYDVRPASSFVGYAGIKF